ncbi:hypothetical protein [Actinopolyspora mortivallis]|uniref:hypothetical protein n=1 Tax=Actinopolyspora mortivallis TaxID=33906 RepID=UPI000368B56C|nr:hypothetical protein [Actinopolyspora mortivallis]
MFLGLPAQPQDFVDELAGSLEQRQRLPCVLVRAGSGRLVQLPAELVQPGPGVLKPLGGCGVEDPL